MASTSPRTGGVLRFAPVLLLFAVVALVLWVQPPGDDGLELLKPERAEAAEPAQAPATVRAETPTATPSPLKPKRPAPLENLDRRAAQPETEPEQSAAALALKQRLPGVSVEFDAITGAPSHIMAVGQFLTAAQPNAAAEPDAALRDFLSQNTALFGHGPEVLAGARRIREDVTAHSGMRTLVWQQELDGVPLYDSILRANLTIGGQLIGLGSHFIPQPERAAELPAAQRTALIDRPPIDAPTAISLAAAELGDRVAPADPHPSTQPEGRERRQRFEAPGLSDVNAALTWLPLARTKVRLAWDVTLMSLTRGEMFRSVVDATTGEVLVRTSRTADISVASYRVFASAMTQQPLDSPTPLSPGHATPLTTQPAQASRVLVTTAALDDNASPRGWIDDDGIATIGNNVDAHLDLTSTNPGYGAGSRASSINRNFDFTLDLTKGPSTYRNAALTQVFYTVNWFHDRLYQLGFTETAGNFQQDNFGLGGNGFDAVIADVQDNSDFNNSNFSTPTDGAPGRLQLFLFTAPNPDRDPAFDSEVVIHEAAHGVSNRLVGGGIGITAVQSRGLGEGWSDFYALALLNDNDQSPNATYAMGAYASYQLSDVGTNYYFGIRRYPYSTDLTKNPLTLKDIDPARASPHTGIPLSPAFVNSNSFPAQVHCQGEVWCSALWDARANLIARYRSAGNALMLQLVTDGMKLTPANPTFLQARDAILQADLVNNGGANREELWNAFAKRGLGSGAVVPPSNTTAGVIEAFDFPDELTVTPGSGITAAGPLGGPFTPAGHGYTVKNTSSSIAVGWTATPSAPWMSLSQSSGTLAPGASTLVTMTFNSDAQSLPAGSYVGHVTFTDTVTGVSRDVAVTLVVGRTDYFTQYFDLELNDTDGQSWLFTPDASASSYSVRRSPVLIFPTDPAGGTNLVLGDDDYREVTPTGPVTLYGVAYNKFYVGSNGYLTFGAADTGLHTTLQGHFALPRISALFTDLRPNAGGNVSWKQLSDRVAVTFSHVPEFYTGEANSFQYELFFDGRIRITCLHIGSSYGIIGLSAGRGVPDDFLESDFNSYAANLLQLSVPALTTEGAGVLSEQGVITLIPAPSSETTITLFSSAAGKLSVPASVIVPPGQSSARFNLSVIDNAALDGTQPVTLTASSPVYGAATATVHVQDNESATLSLSVPASATEGVAPLVGTVSVSAAPASNVTVALSSSDPGAITVPPGVLIPAGKTSATFSVNVIDDVKLDGAQPATITAHVANWTGASASTTVLDNEIAALTVILPPEVGEGGVGSASVVLSGTLAAPLTVSLVPADPQRLTVPATVVVPAGSLSVAFTISAVDDALANGSLPVAVTAAAAGFPNATATVMVRDNDPHHYAIAPVGLAQVRGAPFSVGITALDATGLPIPSHTADLTLSAAAPGGPVSLTPAAPVPLVGGGWSGAVTVNTFANDVVITASDSAGRTGSSNAINVGAGALHHFAWSQIGHPRTQNIGIPVTITAQDAVGNTVTSYAGPAALSATAGASIANVDVLSFTLYAHSDEEYARTKAAIAAHFSSYTETSTHVTDPAALAEALVGKEVFLIVEQEHASSAQLGALGASWAATLQHFVSEGGIVIICSHNGDEHLIATGAGLLAVTKDSSIPGASLVKPANTPLNANVAAPFSGSWISLYNTTDAVVSLADAATGKAVVLHKDVGRGHVVLIGTDFHTTGTPMDRVVANAVSWAQAATVPLTISPESTGSFTAGVWNGEVTVPQSAVSVRLRVAAEGGASGVSNVFDVLAPGALAAPRIEPEPAVSAGLSNTLSWSAVPDADLYEMQASSNGFTTFVSSGWIPGTSTTFAGLQNATTYSYRVRARKAASNPVAESGWSAVVSSIQDTVAPVITVTAPVPRWTSSSIVTVEGEASDANGVESLSVNGVPAATTNGFARWTVSLAGIRAGPNTVSLVAADQASPPNVSTTQITITGLPPDDFDQNGLPDAWEAEYGVGNGAQGSLRNSGVENFTAYALGLDPNAIDYHMLPRVGTIVDPVDGLTYLTFTYRRRIDDVSLSYDIEMTSNMTAWARGGEALTEVPAAALNEDGITQNVTVRISPAIQPGQQRYVRLRVTSSP